MGLFAGKKFSRQTVPAEIVPTFNIGVVRVSSKGDMLRCHSRSLSSIPTSGLRVKYSVSSGTTIITLDRPEKLNAINQSMIQPLKAAFARERDVRQTLIHGSGKGFCAGGDVGGFVKMQPTPMDTPCSDLAFFRDLFALMHQVGSHPEKRLSLVHGVAAGSGMSLSVLGETCIVTEESSFSMPETIIGLTPSAGGSFFLPRLSYSVGIYMGLVGAKLSAREALQLGLASHMTESSSISTLLLDAPNHSTAASLTSHHATTVAAGGWHGEQGPVLSRAEAIHRCFSHSTVDGIVNALRHEEDMGGQHAGWAKQQLVELAARPPTVLAVSLESLLRGRHLDLGECLRSELRVTRRLLSSHDFFEAVSCRFGCRKGSNPTFAPAPTRDQVLEHFELMPADQDLDFDT